jgi:hypothetical protein
MISATANCIHLISVSNSLGSSLRPYYAWSYDPLISEYNGQYYVFQYTNGRGQSAVTQSTGSAPVYPSEPAGPIGIPAVWSLIKEVSVVMRLTLV